VPTGWTVARSGNSVAASSGSLDLLEVLSFTLEKPYSPALFPAASRELDRIAARLAGQLSGHLAERATTEVSGRKVRSYRIEYGGGKTQQIVFVLNGKDEYELLCRRGTAASGSDCSRLFSSFALG
jgi:hypothetical protein